MTTAGPAPPLAGASTEPGSFRDPDSTVFYADGAVYRALSEDGLADFELLASSKLFASETEAGRLVSTELVEGDAAGPRTEQCAGLLRHELIPFVSYPYEWPFGMLRDAALLQLDLLLAAMEEDLMLKDASSYNVQWRGSQPVFVDVGSFEKLRDGEPWIGYRQFCMLFLYPLMLQAYKGLAPHAWLRGSVDGISPGEIRTVMSFRDRFRKGVTPHVMLHARLERSHGEPGKEAKSELAKAGFKKEIIKANVTKLKKLITRLDWSPPKGVWTEYEGATTYSDAEADKKAEFIRQVAGSRDWGLVWDLGCNAGRYSRIAAEGARHLVAVDADQGPVEFFYRKLREEGNTKITTLTMNLTDPSPGLGWRGLERKPLAERGTPDLTLCLALIHHVSIAGNVPVREYIDWLASLGTAVIIEFPEREDPMVKTLLGAKREGLHPDYETTFFERALGEAFEIERREQISDTRLLFFARPKGAPASA